ncbi:amidohydrolase [Sphaerochaeta sp. PS]|uniref:amidohydrolase n=1 Tax=Sphaerochaeta sp. PS TaxID=3076336 RepID=UPI0028A463AB|nr:amidohydrolase [Sphaerochaeta sp. PS]MDT4761602.1 amidohydrolase [Sphaerochaeta sp. PS]
MELVLRHAVILTEDSNQSIIADGALVIRGEVIDFVGPDGSLPHQFALLPSLDCSDCLIMPALINSHTHTGMVAFRSLGDDVADRLKRFLLPLEATCMTEELAALSAKIAMAEMQLAGIGTAVDMYYFEEAIARAASEMHFRLLGSETIMEESPCNSANGEEGLSYAENLLSSTKDNPWFKPLFSAHAPYSVTSDTLLAISHMAREHRMKWTMHLSEMDFEMEQFQKTYNKTPIGYLAEIGVLDDRLLAVHCIHTTDEDLALLANQGTAVVHCPGANAKSGKGIAQVYKMLKLGIPVCLGTDGPASGNTLDLFTQMKLCAILQKTWNKDRTILPAKAVVPMATSVAAKVLGLGAELGSLETGKLADILVLGLDSPNMIPCFDPYSLVVYSAGVQNVRHLFTKGEWVVKDHELTQVDSRLLRSEFLLASKAFAEEAKSRL